MKITRDEARRIAGLAHLEFEDAELDRLAAEMTQILEYVDQLPPVSPAASEQVGEREQKEAADAGAALRDDVARQYPKIADGFYVVPKVIE